MFGRKKEWRPDVIVIFTHHTGADSPVNMAISKRMEMLANIYRGIPLFFDKFHRISYTRDGVKIGGEFPSEGHFQGSLEFFVMFLHQAQLARWKKVLLVVEPKEAANFVKRLWEKKFEVKKDTYLEEVYPKKFWY